MKATDSTFDIVIIGAGLAGGLLALRMKAANPKSRVLVLEKMSRGSLTKTWSCHDSDLAGNTWARELMSRTWPGYDVSFPHRSRTLETRYHSLFPETLHEKLEEILGADLRFDVEVTAHDSESVTLLDGTRIQSPCIVDSSLPLAWDAERCGFQKFVGLHVKLDRPHGLKRPMLMDARVPQLDGFRFFYVLPFAEDELLIEDTRFSETDKLERGEYLQEITAYATKRNWTIAKTLRAEVGVLPLPLAPAAVTSRGGAEVGMAAGFFHVVTGYSLPDAVRTANELATLSPLTTETARRALAKYREQQSTQRSYLHLLNRMMFRAARPEERYRIFERFYGLSEPLIARFYRGELNVADRVRILVGRPPVPVTSALRCLFDGGRAPA